MTRPRARELGVPILDNRTVREVRTAVQELEPDAVVVSSFDRILDAGGIRYQATVPIGPDDTVADLYRELNELQRRHIAAATAAAIAGEPGGQRVEADATYYCTGIPEDGEIDWSQGTIQIHRLVRALQAPFPSAFTWLGLDQVHLEAASPIDNAPAYEGRVPGRVVRVDVLTGDGVLRLERVRVEDGDPLGAAEVIRSVKSTLGPRAVDLVRALRPAR